ncbi:APC family permease [Yinghuangia soli]|uniref:APC family permease n=1 Tax=Yinghuangia soli TaxID=2908204 RepID=A0AA41PX92_9ACTN|nr:APC family permease [Yinghuangia soli]MCF2527381.1 APC family permease [Yinghuangia soli]
MGSGDGNAKGKGLGKGSIGLLGSTVLGLSSVAPVYALTSTLGPTAGEVGVHLPAIFLAGFLPMLLVAFAYRELNRRIPDCGTSFTWTVKAFGPWVGWMCGWGMMLSTIIVLASQAGVATSFLYLTAGEAFNSDWIAGLDDNKPVHVATCLVVIAVATVLSCRKMTDGKVLQYTLVFFQMAVLTVFTVVLFLRVAEGGTPGSLDFSWSWLNPASGFSVAAFTAGLSLSIFMYWGWDTSLSANEETVGSTRTPGRAALLAMVILVLSYCLCGIAALMYAGTGTEGLGLNNPDTQDNVFAALADPVLGSWLGLALFLAVLASSAGSLQTTFIPGARTLLAMSAYKALPAKFAAVHPRMKTPVFATVVQGVATGVFYAVMTFLSENVLVDAIYALGLMICFYYSLTAFACAWYFRHEAMRSVRDFAVKSAIPIVGGIMLSAVFLKTLYDIWDPAYGSGSQIFGMGSVFLIGVGLLVLGVFVMLAVNVFQPAFFRGETLNAKTAVHTEDDLLSD